MVRASRVLDAVDVAVSKEKKDDVKECHDETEGMKEKKSLGKIRNAPKRKERLYV